MLIPNIVIACCVAVMLAPSCLAADEPAQSNVTSVLIDKVAVEGRLQILGAPEPGGGTTVRLILPVAQLLARVAKKTGNHHGTKT
jgi:hypothetical protein